MGHYSYSVYGKKGIAAKFDKEKLGNKVSRMFLEEQQEWILKALGNIKNKKILDVGAGTGRVSLHLAKAKAIVTASDASDEMLTTAKEKAGKNNVKIKFELSDVHNLPFRDLEFDAVVSIRTVMHVVDWKKALSEMCRVSRKNLVIDFPPRVGFAFFAPTLSRIKKWFAKDTQNYRVFTIKKVEKELFKNNFVISSVKRQYVLPLILHKVVNSTSFSKFAEWPFGLIGLKRVFGSPVTICAVRNHNKCL